MSFKTTATIASFGGKLLKLTHEAQTTGCEMALNVYLPPSAGKTANKVPVLFYLSGLTCTGDNCAEKGFFQYGASQRGIAIVYPDTSPRGLKIQGEDDSYDFGSGAGFYIDATASPWSKNYKMESYITSELPKALFASFPELDSSRVSITGHSMGGHGALTLFLKNPGMYKSVSAFAPIANPSNCPWGEKAFKGYLGEDREAWKKHDASELVKRCKAGTFEALIDVGTGDNFYKQGQLLPENFEKAAKESGNDKGLVLRYQDASVNLGGDRKVLRVLTMNRAMTTLIILFRHFRRIMSITQRSICSQHEATLPRDKSYRMKYTLRNLSFLDRTPSFRDS